MTKELTREDYQLLHLQHYILGIPIDQSELESLLNPLEDYQTISFTRQMEILQSKPAYWIESEFNWAEYDHIIKELEKSILSGEYLK